MQPLSATSALLLALVACDNKSSSTAAPSARTSATAVRSAAPPPSPPSAEPPPELPRCRVIASRPNPGKAADAGAPAPAVGTLFEGKEWLELGAFEVVLRHASTTRELSLRGPGRFLPCFLGTETVLVAAGWVKTTAGAGARAGAEVVLATPFGTLHFADAALEARVGERELEVKVETGVATLVPAAGPKPGADAGAPDQVLGPKSKKRLSGAVDAKALIERCGEASSPLGTTPPTAPSARSELGKWSVAQLRARQTARWACATARAAAGRDSEPERTRRSREIDGLDRVWQAAGLQAGK